jgi:hypothetical protein
MWLPLIVFMHEQKREQHCRDNEPRSFQWKAGDIGLTVEQTCMVYVLHVT